MDFLSADAYSVALRASYFVASIPTALVIITSVLSAKQLGGTLGTGIRKIAAGSIIHTILILTFMALEQGAKGLLSERIIQMFFIGSGTFGSVWLISGYLQIYHIARKLKLFTV